MAGSARYTAMLVAITLYTAPLCDLLLSLAVDGPYHARWIALIHAEWVRNLARNRPEIEPRLDKVVELINRLGPDCLGSLPCPGVQQTTLIIPKIMDVGANFLRLLVSEAVLRSSIE